MAALEINYVDPAKLTPHPRNARRHNAKQIDQIGASITEFGFNAPILIDGAGMVLAGHGRLSAAVKLGLNQVPVVRIEHLSEGQSAARLPGDRAQAAAGARGG